MKSIARKLRALSFVLLSIWINDAKAALYDEFQVYDDSLNAPGEYGLELHLNHTVKGRATAVYPGEITPNKGTRITPEFSYGINTNWEAGLYLPTVLDQQNQFGFAGPKLRMKWIGQHSDIDTYWFYGLNFELAKVLPRYEASAWGSEIRPIIGYRSDNWLIVTNPILEYALSPGYRKGGFDFLPAVKISRRFGEGLATGIETYSDLGKLVKLTSDLERQHALYWVLDVDRGPWVFNVGIGHGLNALSDQWTIKAIFEIPLAK